MKKRRIYYRPALKTDAEVIFHPERKSDNLILTERLLNDMLQHLEMREISESSGVSAWTLRNLAQGKSRRVTRQVLFAIQGLYNRWRNGLPLTAVAKVERSGEEAVVEPDTAASSPAETAARRSSAGVQPPSSFSGAMNSRSPRGINMPAIEAEIERIEKRIRILNRLRDLIARL